MAFVRLHRGLRQEPVVAFEAPQGNRDEQRVRVNVLDHELAEGLEVGALEAIPSNRGGHPRREPTEVEAEALRRYFGTGRPIAAMARAFGVSEGTFRRWAREAGLLKT